MRLLFFMIILCLQSGFTLAGETRYLGHVTSPTAGFKTQLLLSNFAPTPKTLDVFAYQNFGVLIASKTITLPGKNFVSLDVFELFESNAISYLTLSGSRMITATLKISPANDSGAGDALIPETSDMGRFFRIYPTRHLSDDAAWEALAITDYHLGQEYLDEVRISLFTPDSSEPVAVQTFQITGGEKKLVNLTTLFPQTASLPYPELGFYYEVSSGPEVVVTALRGHQGRLEASTVPSFYPRDVEKPSIKVEPSAEGGQLNEVNFDSRFLTLNLTLANACQQVSFQWDGTTEGDTARFQLGYHPSAEVCTDALVEVEKELDLLDIFNAWEQALRTLLILDVEGHELARISLRP